MSSLDAAIYNEARKAAAKSAQRMLIYRRVVTASEVLTLPTGHYDIIAVGAAGSGGAAVGANARATGGGGPAWARDWGVFDAPTVVTITVGARAAGVNSSSVLDGISGGTTTITGISSPITLTGGEGGKANASIGSPAGGTGGAATGGKIRANGGRGGNVSSASAGLRATGGGALDIFCLGSNVTRGGDFTGSASTGSIGTGGGGVGGRGGDRTDASASNTTGGGAGGSAQDNSTSSSGPAIDGVTSAAYAPPDAAAVDVLLAYPVLRPVSSGGVSVGTPIPPGGGGAGGVTTGAAVELGGSGGVAGSSGNISGHSARGGGSGGNAVSSGTAVSGAAGAAVCIVSVYAEVA